MRDEFEVKLAERLAHLYPASAPGLLESLRKMRDGEGYHSMSVTGRMIALQATMAWWAWRESRACCVVELPPKAGHVVRVHHDDLIEAVRQCIEAAGLKVKP